MMTITACPEGGDAGPGRTVLRGEGEGPVCVLSYVEGWGPGRAGLLSYVGRLHHSIHIIYIYIYVYVYIYIHI